MTSAELCSTSHGCSCEMSQCVCSDICHEQKSEGEPFFCSSPMSKEVYVRFLESLYLVYGAMEDELTKNVNGNRISYPFEEVLFEKELFRRTALEKDLKIFAGPNWKRDLVSTRATDAYVGRIRQVGKEDPDALLAHHSTRYMGDLYASSSMRDKTRRCFDLDPNSQDGVAFYDFSLIPYPEKFKREYFDTIEELTMNEETRNKISKEAKLVYQLNLNLYWELRSFMVSMDEDRLCPIDGKYGSFCQVRSRRDSSADDSMSENSKTFCANAAEGEFTEEDNRVFMERNESVERGEILFRSHRSSQLLQGLPLEGRESATSNVNARKSVRIEADDNYTENYDDERKKKREKKCSGLPMFAYSLLFWIVIWVAGSLLIYAWMHPDDVSNVVKLYR